jgi:hypothetical protein
MLSGTQCRLDAFHSDDIENFSNFAIDMHELLKEVLENSEHQFPALRVLLCNEVASFVYETLLRVGRRFLR